MTNRAPPRSIRSRRSAGPTAVVVGMITAPSLMIPSIVSQSSTWLPSMTITASPLVTPWPASQAATWSDRRRLVRLLGGGRGAAPSLGQPLLLLVHAQLLLVHPVRGLLVSLETRSV